MNISTLSLKNILLFSVNKFFFLLLFRKPKARENNTFIVLNDSIQFDQYVKLKYIIT